MKQTIDKLRYTRNALLNEKARLVEQLNTGGRNSHKIGLQISPINDKIKSINLELNSYREYFKYKILWDCAKAYVPIEDREKFYAKVDAMVQEETGYDKEI